jgi:hypothetical protein
MNLDAQGPIWKDREQSYEKLRTTKLKNSITRSNHIPQLQLDLTKYGLFKMLKLDRLGGVKIFVNPPTLIVGCLDG